MVIRHLIASLALLTRLPGFIASYVADTLLKHEYRVRGTARSLEKLAALQALFDNKYGVGRFESAVVADMAVDGAFDTAMRGFAGVAHVASIMPNQADPASLSNPELVIGPVVAGTLSVLKTAAATPSIDKLAQLPPRHRRFTHRLPARLRRIIQKTRRYTTSSQLQRPPQHCAETQNDSMVYRYPTTLASVFKQTILKSHLDRDASVGAHVERGWATLVVPRQGARRIFMR